MEVTDSIKHTSLLDHIINHRKAKNWINMRFLLILTVPRRLPHWHLTDWHLTDWRLNDWHLTDRRLNDWHLTDRRLSDWHLADRLLANRHISGTMFESTQRPVNSSTDKVLMLCRPNVCRPKRFSVKRGGTKLTQFQFVFRGKTKITLVLMDSVKIQFLIQSKYFWVG